MNLRIDHALSRRRRKSSSRHQIINHRWRLIAIYGSANKRVCKYNSVTAMIKMPRCNPVRSEGRYCGTYQFKSRYRPTWSWNPRLRERLIPIKTNDVTFAVLLRYIPNANIDGCYCDIISHSLVIKLRSQPSYLSLLARRQQSIWLTLDALWFICAPNIEWIDRRMRNWTFNPRVN